MIQSFANEETRSFFRGGHSRRWDAIQVPARRKLAQLDYAKSVEDVRWPPGNKLEHLKGDRAGQCSICINRKWRICFVWHDGAPHDVEIVDYH